MNLQPILQLPFEQKCEQLAIYTDQCLLSTLESVFPTIVSDIFGTNQPSGFNGWNLCKHSNNLNSRDCVAAFNFLSPNNGTIFKIIYTLLKDSNIKYRFPFEYLPLDIQKSLKDGTGPQFYLDKLALDPKTRQVLYLYLNPFQYYMFTFVKYLCDKGKSEENLEIQLNVDTLYQRVLAEYCDKFLPVTHNLPVEPNVYHTQSITPSLNTSAVVNSPKNKSNLLKPHVFSTSPQTPNSRFPGSPSYPLNASSVNSSAVLPSTNIGEVWRSELLVHLFTDYWMQYDDSLHMGFSKTRQSSFSQLYRKSPSNQQNSVWSIPVFPSGYQVRCIRYVIKHFHQFSTERLQDSSSLGQFRRAVLPLTQARIYDFLEHHIAHWPLDSSFKLIQETWFSFIQPWRYSGVSQPNEEDDVGLSVDRVWAHFITENLAAYTNLLHLVLDRFLRLDFNNLFNAHLVFRVSKVYSIPNLCPLIKEIEASVYNDSLSNKYGGDPALRLFSLETTKKVHQVMQRIQASIAHCQRELSSPSPPSLSLWNSIRAEVHQFLYAYSSVPRTDENTRTNLSHTIRYLSQTLAWFQQIFNIPPPPQPSAPTAPPAPNFPNPSYMNRTLDSSEFMDRSFDSQFNLDRTLDNTLVTGDVVSNVTSGNQTSVTEDGHSFLLSPPPISRVRDLKYDGDPELLPPGSGEIAFLVRFLYRWSVYLNITLYDRIQEIYSRNSGFLPLLLHATLEPPSVFYKYERHAHLAGVKVKVPVHLPAHISLRPFASYSLLCNFLLYSLVMKLVLNVNGGVGMICVLILWLVWKVIGKLIFG